MPTGRNIPFEKFNKMVDVTPNQAKQLGKQVGADAIVTGTVTDLGSIVKINARMIEVEKEDVLAVAGAEVSKDRVIAELLKQLLSGPPQVSAAMKELQQEQLAGGQGATIAIAPSAAANTKKVGNVIITLKRITVSKGRVTVMLDFLNQSDREIKLAREPYDRTRPNLMDERGNIFKYDAGLESEYDNWLPKAGHGLTLNPKSSNDVVLTFEIDRETPVKDIGGNFTLSLSLLLYDSGDQSVSRHQVSFTDIKAQLPK